MSKKTFFSKEMIQFRAQNTHNELGRPLKNTFCFQASEKVQKTAANEAAYAQQQQQRQPKKVKKKKQR